MRLNREKILGTVTEVLSIPSPTFKEKRLSRHIEKQYFSYPQYQILRAGDSFIVTRKRKLESKSEIKKPHLVLVAHLDVVPKFFKPYRKRGRLYGAGASDMQSSLGVFLHLVKVHPQLLDSRYCVSFIFYAKEEETPLEDNGLYDLIKKFPQWFKTIDLAIVGEPTDNTVQVGCCGSIHAQVRILGKACHSARPWQGKNALYQALPFLNRIARVHPRSYRVGGVVFKDVWQVTVGKTQGGTTTLPEVWEGNVNYRFAPLQGRQSRRKIIDEFKGFLIKQGLASNEFKIKSYSPMGQIVETPLYLEVVNYLREKGMSVEAKQAWTDVAQLGGLGISSFNCGPGLSSQCHTPKEYILENYIIRYTQILMELLQYRKTY